MYTVDEITKIVDGQLLRGDRTSPRRWVHDSRDVREGDLFVALRGQCTDGHVFLPEVFARGACGALISDPLEAPADASNLIVVEDPLAALQRLATTWRRTLGATFIGITGSNGKTTTRALLANLLSAPQSGHSVYSAPKNYNTEVGLPLALLAMPEQASIGLFELGAERPGDIALLADILTPQIGIITSIGPSHLKQFGSIDAVATEKWSFIEALPRDSIAFVNADSPQLRQRTQQMSHRCISTGIDHGEFRGRVEQEAPRLVVRVEDPPLRLAPPLLGAHNATNTLLAAAVALHLGLSQAELERQMQQFVSVPHRLQEIDASIGTVLDDTYNANPASTAAAVRTLSQLGTAETFRILVFGEMLDLGPGGGRAHREILDLALRLGIDAVLPVGKAALAACRSRQSPSILIADRDKIGHTVRQLCRQADDAVVLVKGSRALHLDRLVDELSC